MFAKSQSDWRGELRIQLTLVTKIRITMQKGVLMVKIPGRQELGRSFRAGYCLPLFRVSECYDAHIASMIPHCYWLLMGKLNMSVRSRFQALSLDWLIIYCYLYRSRPTMNPVRFRGSSSRPLNYFPIISLISHIPYSFLWMVASYWPSATTVNRKKASIDFPMGNEITSCTWCAFAYCSSALKLTSKDSNKTFLF